MALVDVVASSTEQFTTTTGFAYTELVSVVGDWIKMFLGAGLGLVEAILPWVIALIIFGVVIGLIYKAMRFLHILR